MEANNSQLVIYQTPDGNMSIDVTVENETVWLSQGQMAELFDKDQSVIARHITNVFKEGELQESAGFIQSRRLQYYQKRSRCFFGKCGA